MVAMTALHDTSIPATSSPLRSLAPRLSDVPLLAVYAAAFALLHWAARPWGGAGFFSLWYPAAGLRFAVLWHRGARLTPWLMLTELAVDCMTGTVAPGGMQMLQGAIGAFRPGLACGLAVVLVRHAMRRGTGPLSLSPMPFGLAALIAPGLNALLVVPTEALLPSDDGEYRSGVDVVISLSGLVVGDLLGILVLAPPLLWLAGAIAAPASLRTTPRRYRTLPEAGLVLGLCLVITMELWRAGLGVQPIPALLAGAWIGLRHGRTAAWFAILVAVALFLPYSAGALDDATRLELHLGIAAVVIVTWLAGSFSDAQSASRALLERRNRMLFQAERLKTLRAMSVAVIHEISQPLSTLAIEASHLKDRAANLEPDIAESAALVDRKARTLSDMVRRLRRFGGRDVDEPSVLPIAMLVQTARQIAAAELRAAGCRVVEAGAVDPDLTVQAQEIELTQALVNLLRNAAAATSDGKVGLSVSNDAEKVAIEITNRLSPTAASAAGMGVGLIIARTIIEAHGGALARRDEPGLARFVLSLPLAGPTP